MSATSVTLWYGVCDRCGTQDDDSRPTEREARDRMWPSIDGPEELCWDCCQAEDDGDISEDQP